MKRNPLPIITVIVLALLLCAALVNRTRAQMVFGGDNTFAAANMQQASVTTDASGLYVWDFAVLYAPGTVPNCWAQAVGPNPQAGVVVNVQTEGMPTNAQARFRVTKSNVTLVGLLGISVLSIPASVGATVINVFCDKP